MNDEEVEEDDVTSESEDDTGGVLFHPHANRYIHKYLEEVPELIDGLFTGKTVSDFSILVDAINATDLTAISREVLHFETGYTSSNPLQIFDKPEVQGEIESLCKNIYLKATGNPAPENVVEILGGDISNLFDVAISAINGYPISEDDAVGVYKLSDEILRLETAE